MRLLHFIAEEGPEEYIVFTRSEKPSGYFQRSGYRIDSDTDLQGTPVPYTGVPEIVEFHKKI